MRKADSRKAPRTMPEAEYARRPAEGTRRGLNPWVVCCALVGVLVACGGQVPQAAPIISTADVHHFVDAARRITPKDSSCAALADYFANGSDGLAAYSRKFSMTRADLCLAVRTHPARYAALDSVLPTLDSAAASSRAVSARLLALDPAARLPNVYVVVGNGISGGTTVGMRSPAVLVGAELMRSASGLPWTVAHELAHTQQHYPWWGMLTGGPRFMRATLLRQSLTEGIADVVAEFLTGNPKHNAYGESHEVDLWSEFQRDMHGHDYAGWLYGARKAGKPDRPNDLGYWIGYRIAKSYLDRASDKPRAVRDMLAIRDFDEFLVSSGYQGGR